MWCPKCKTEYVSGVTVCADCGSELVEELTPDMYEQDEELIVPKNMEKKLEEYSQKQQEVVDLKPEEPAKVYVKKDNKLEDIKSTAYTFVIIGVLGIAAIILMNLGVLPIAMAGYMKILMTVVMGALFLIFLVIGIRYFTKIKSIQEEANEEKDFTENIVSWFLHSYSARAIDEQAGILDQQELEQKYFKRYQFMEQELTSHYPDLDSSFQDFLLEKIYNEVFPENE